MAIKEIEEFKKENPSFPQYILDEVEKNLPSGISSKKIQEVLEKVKQEYEDSLINPYEAIGVITAQSVGEPSTQMTLNTFHFAGVATQSVEGLPRLIEILDVKKNIKNSQMKIYLDKKQVNENKLKTLAKKIKETTLEEFTNGVDINLEEKQVIVNLDVKLLKECSIELESLISLIDKKYRNNAKIEGKNLILKGSQNASQTDLMKIKEETLKTIIYGIKGIKDVSLIKEEDEYLIKTEGVALKQILALEEVNVKRIYCNNIQEVYSNFGIEAAREVIIKEILEIVNSQGLSINLRHVYLLADIMTFTGEPKGMTRFGIVAQKQNVLTRASFETPLKHIKYGAIMNEENKLSSITENVMTNQIINVGTGIPKVKVKKM